ncbi:hypothetical protein DPMN_033548 [Dreissena polymorpha]|uniref:Uncharacterized protein n=1 Tax=Dreissena polymorpha TaxID=45954 RepID=A0A9D4M402_DREPO|nr:hypothetical protein DPMN_033548 [Dreissena polymorpha]
MILSLWKCDTSAHLGKTFRHVSQTSSKIELLAFACGKASKPGTPSSNKQEKGCTLVSGALNTAALGRWGSSSLVGDGNL